MTLAFAGHLESDLVLDTYENIQEFARDTGAAAAYSLSDTLDLGEQSLVSTS